MAFLSKLLWQKGFLLSSLNPHSQLQLPQFITHSALKKMSLKQLLTQVAVSAVSGFIPITFLYFVQDRQQDFRFNAIDTRLDTMDTRLDTMDTRLDTMDTRLGRLERGVKNLSAQTTDCTADCAGAKRALLGYGLLPRRLNTVEKKFGGQNGLVTQLRTAT